MVSIDVAEYSSLGAAPPPGWQIFSHRFCHSEWDGVTDGEATLAVLAPQAKMTLRPLQDQPPVQTWRLFYESIDSLIGASPADAKAKPTPSEDKVYWRGGDVLPWGLFPSARPSSVVWVPCVYNCPIR